MRRSIATTMLAGAAAAMTVPPTASAAALALQPATGFRFETIDSIEDMHRHVNEAFRLGSPGADLRRHFVAEGGATRIAHPSRDRVEKYVYDINLCSFYVWRWNISADYDPQDRVRQIYVNGEPVLADGQGEPAFDAAAYANRPGVMNSISRMSRPRPEASRGESSLGYILFDGDSNQATIEDQQLMGAGPSRPHPAEMGRMRAYQVDPWRSIFDSDAAARIVPYSGDCAPAEAAMAAQARQPR